MPTYDTKKHEFKASQKIHENDDYYRDFLTLNMPRQTAYKLAVHIINQLANHSDSSHFVEIYFHGYLDSNT